MIKRLMQLINGLLKANMYVKWLLILEGAFLIYLIFLLMPHVEENDYSFDDLKRDYVYGEFVNDNEYITLFDGFELASGSYEISIELEDGGHDSVLSGSVLFGSKESYSSIQAGQTNFKYCDKPICADINVPLFENIDDLQIVVYSNQEISVRSIAITEKYVYRVTRILIVLTLFVMFDWILLCSNIWHKEKSEKIISAVLLVGILLVSIPLIGATCYGGDDWIFHYSRIEGISQELLAGNIPVRIYSQVNNGYGYAAPLFYGEIFLYLPALLYAMRIPLFICGNIYFLIVNVFTCKAAYYSFREISRDNIAGTVGALLYLCSPYRIYCLYTRCALGEVTAMLFLPLVAVGIYRIYCNETSNVKNLWPIVLGVSGIIESHIITTEIVSIMLVIIAVFLWKKTFRRNIIKKWGIVLLLVLGINIWFIGPLLDSLSMDIVMKQGSKSIQNEGLSLTDLLGISIKYPNGRTIGYILVMMALIGGIISIIAKSKHIGGQRGRIVYIGVVIFVISTFLSSIYFPWDKLGDISQTVSYYLTAIQFPWRYLTIAVLAGTIIATVGMALMKDVGTKEKHRIVVLAIVLCVVGVSSFVYILDVLRNNPRADYYMVNEPTFFIRMDDYLLERTTWEDMQNVENYSGNYIVERTDDANVFWVENKSDKTVVKLPKVAYDYLKYNDEAGKEIDVIRDAEYASIVVPAYFSGLINVEFKPPIWWHICEIVSVIVIGGYSLTLRKINIRAKK